MIKNPNLFKKINYNTIPIMKVSIEPINPSELPKMKDGLIKINKTYPLVYLFIFNKFLKKKGKIIYLINF
jgi:translation elongation factor EF-G